MNRSDGCGHRPTPVVSRSLVLMRQLRHDRRRRGCTATLKGSAAPAIPVQRIRLALDEGRGVRETARLLKVSAAKVSEVRRMSAGAVTPI